MPGGPLSLAKEIDRIVRLYHAVADPAMERRAEQIRKQIEKNNAFLARLKEDTHA
jgi:hypothetical protein